MQGKKARMSISEQTTCASERSSFSSVDCRCIAQKWGSCQNRTGRPFMRQNLPFFFMRCRVWLGGAGFVWGGVSVHGATGISLLDSCAKQGKAGSCLLLPELRSSSTAKGGWVWRTMLLGGHHQAPWLETSLKQKEPTGPLSHLAVPSLTIEYNGSLKNINSIWLIWKEWLVPEAGQLQWKWDSQCFGRLPKQHKFWAGSGRQDKEVDANAVC